MVLAQNPEGPKPSAVRWDRLWAPLFMMAGISILSGSSGIQTGDWSFRGIDKVGHLVVFGLLAVAWVRFLGPEAHALFRRWATAVFLTTLFGFIDELHQFFNPERYFEWGDLLADFLGAAGFAALYLLAPFVQSILELELRFERRLRLSGNPSNSSE